MSARSGFIAQEMMVSSPFVAAILNNEPTSRNILFLSAVEDPTKSVTKFGSLVSGATKLSMSSLFATLILSMAILLVSRL